MSDDVLGSPGTVKRDNRAIFAAAHAQRAADFLHGLQAAPHWRMPPHEPH